eukprot:6188503-Pleurochrysis_carterae.AAC.2
MSLLYSDPASGIALLVLEKDVSIDAEEIRGILRPASMLLAAQTSVRPASSHARSPHGSTATPHPPTSTAIPTEAACVHAGR